MRLLASVSGRAVKHLKATHEENVIKGLALEFNYVYICAR